MAENTVRNTQTTGSKAALILFVNYPKPGKVKTRLAHETNENFATDIYCCFIKDSLERFRNIKADLIPFISEKNKVRSFQQNFNFTSKCYDQSSGHLGIRMKHAMKVMFSDKFNHVAIIGSDCPDIPLSYINNAFSKLVKNDVVIGPSGNGGYYFIGCSNPRALNSLFNDIEWNTDKVVLQTINKIKTEGFSYSLVKEWRDIDCLEDLKNCNRNAGKRKFTHSHTINYLRTNK
ncbi:MAG: glycosyltransferase [Planctomycetes bacterium]|nr:glycosyltransferase [Planctomycetota bacterium]